MSCGFVIIPDVSEASYRNLLQAWSLLGLLDSENEGVMILITAVISIMTHYL
jgi:hypothetical protein